MNKNVSGAKALFAMLLGLICILVVSCRKIPPEVLVDSEKNTLYLTKKTHNYSVGPEESYSCTVLDEGVLKLLDYRDSEDYLNGHVQIWKYEIVSPGTVRILWESESVGRIFDRHIDIFTIDEDLNYSIKKDYLLDCLRYLVVGPSNDQIDFIEGYLVDLNGVKYSYNIDKNQLPEVSIAAIFDYFFSNKDEFELVEFLDQTQLDKNITYILQRGLYDRDYPNPEIQLDDKCRVYYFEPYVSNGNLVDYRYYLIATKNTRCVDEVHVLIPTRIVEQLISSPE